MLKAIAVQVAQLKGSITYPLRLMTYAICSIASFCRTLSCHISDADKSVHPPTPDNGGLEAKMAEYARLYHLS